MTDTVDTAAPDTGDLRLMDAKELGALIGRSTKSIKVDVYRRPNTLPPRFVIPGTAKIQWRVVDVRRWMEALAALQEQNRVEQRKLAARLGQRPAVGTASFHLGSKEIGERARAAMAGVPK